MNKSSWSHINCVSISIIIAVSQVVILGFERSINAQIIPDETLGQENSVVTDDEINGVESQRISGGAVRGGNLFHSFQEFNVGEGRGAYFNNPEAIQNIFSRITGSSPSNILGTLGVLGNANLFLMNPNGIIFGENASLNIRGSFLATTADSILFPNGNGFSAINPEAAPLLTVNVRQPIGLQFEGQSGMITNRGVLEVDAGENLAFLGGDLVIDGGTLKAPGGHIELGSIARNGLVWIEESDTDLNFLYDSISSFGNIELDRSATLDTSENGAGSINLRGNQVFLNNNSRIISHNIGSESGKDITVNARTLFINNKSSIVTIGLWTKKGKVR